MFDRSSALPPLGLLRHYLQRGGWVRQALKNPALELFVLPGRPGEEIEIVLSKEADSPDADKRILQALQTLSDLELWSIEDLASYISALDFDRFLVKMPNRLMLRSTLRFTLVERFLGDMKRFLLNSAAAHMSGDIVVQKAGEGAYKFLNACRFGHTFPGSFGFTIEAEVGSNTTGGIVGNSPPPVERRVFERIARGLQYVQRAESFDDPEPLYLGAGDGFNANMLESMVAMIDRTEADHVGFGFALSSAWPTFIDRGTQYNITSSAIPLMEKVIADWKRERPTPPERIIGTIFRLETRDIPMDLLHASARRAIAVDVKGGDRDGSSIRIHVTPDEYLQAVDAHQYGLLVSVRGKVERKGRGYVLSEPEGFKVLSPDD